MRKGGSKQSSKREKGEEVVSRHIAEDKTLRRITPPNEEVNHMH